MSSQILSPGVSRIRNLSAMDAPQRLPADEIVNTITHGIGIPLSIAGATLLLASALETADLWRISGCAIYSVMLVGVFTASTLSHCFVCPQCRNFFRALDQALIYVFIAGSYTPFALVYLPGVLWNALLTVIWAIALSGFISKLGFKHRINASRAWTYVVLAWLTAIPAVAMIGTVPTGLHFWAFLGAGAFMLGMVFYLLDIKRYHFHAMWHVLVIAGCACHFIALYSYVAIA